MNEPGGAKSRGAAGKQQHLFPSDEELERLPLSAELLEYYRARVREFESERAYVDQKLSKLESVYDEVQDLRSELKKRDDDIVQLQKALSHSRASVHDERQELLRVRADYDALRIQEAEDRRRIQHLLALTGATGPVGQEITYLRHTAPERIAVRPPSSGPSRASAPGSAATTASAGSRGAGQEPTPIGGPTRVLRTIYMPSEKMDTLLLTLEALRAQLDEERKANSAQIAALKQQVQQLEEAAHTRHTDEGARHRDLSDQLARAEAQILHLTRELLHARSDAAAAQRRMKEDNEALLEQNRRLAAQVLKTQWRAEVGLRAVLEETARTNEEIVDDLRAQLMRRKG